MANKKQAATIALTFNNIPVFNIKTGDDINEAVKVEYLKNEKELIITSGGIETYLPQEIFQEIIEFININK